VQGRASIKDEHTVLINGKEVTTKYICVAVGGSPTVLNIPGAHL
jgi:glutathione reductase (NADPH)